MEQIIIALDISAFLKSASHLISILGDKDESRDNSYSANTAISNALVKTLCYTIRIWGEDVLIDAGDVGKTRITGHELAVMFLNVGSDLTMLSYGPCVGWGPVIVSVLYDISDDNGIRRETIMNQALAIASVVPSVPKPFI